MTDKDFKAWLDEIDPAGMSAGPFRKGARAAWAKAQDEVENLEQKLAIAVQALEILKVAVNDKQKDPGATLFIETKLAKIKGGESE